MTMLIAWENKADDATVSSDSELETLPAANVQHEHMSRKWYSAAADNDAYLIFDMGSSVTADLIAVLGSNLTDTATIRIRASDSDPTVTAGLLLDTGVAAGGVKSDYGAIYKQVASTTARYWRIDLDDAALTQLRVGRVFIGPSWQPEYNMMLGVSYLSQDNSIIERSRAGQRFAEVMSKQRAIQFELDFLSESDMFDNAFAFAHRNGSVIDVLVVPDINGTYLSEKSVFGICSAAQPIVNDKLYLYRQKFTVEERL